MKKNLTSLFLFVSLLLVPSMAMAGAASAYKVTITTMELFNGTTWVTVFTGSSATIDIASAAAGSSAGNFLSGIIIPDGTYTQVRTTVSPTITISGLDSSRYTTAATFTSGGNTGCIGTATAADEVECVAIVNATPQETTTFSAPITALNNNLSHKIRVEFDVSAAITYNNTGGINTLFPNAPTVTVTAIPLE